MVDNVTRQVSAAGRVVSNPAHISLVLPDGTEAAGADYESPGLPNVGNAGAILPPWVQTTSHAVYYADNQGTVRRLTADHLVKPVATIAGNVMTADYRNDQVGIVSMASPGQLTALRLRGNVVGAITA